MCLARVSFSQEQDSVLISGASSAFDLASVNSDSAYHIAKKVLKQSENKGFTRGMANSYNAMGWAYMHQGKMDSFLLFLREAKKLFQKESSDFDVFYQPILYHPIRVLQVLIHFDNFT
ncbi:hypothetical protein M3O96_07120 [Aquiflexum sp. TKW24L]|uniref:hypothetical protein n=1 Tax=Aquiflexum sp. TKW24L TaxID=2942212 RepID=UPI0020BD5AB9|nr:hypothetical protein [Aquiflexum sp. TKW24L]MCL6258849.1 hypothetical protein [Aquiflexum sp. TKW24L]